jgi:hypothetical protein
MDNLPKDGLLARALACVCASFALYSFCISSNEDPLHVRRKLHMESMSPMGKIAQHFVTAPFSGSGYADAPPVYKAQTCVAADASGAHILVAFNDPRGFTRTPICTSGYMVSDDGGLTFTDLGQLPIVEQANVKGIAYPQLFGHPDVKYLGGSNFIYASLMVKAASETSTVQTLCIYRSSDYGHSWQGPFEIDASSSGDLQSGWASDAADKEFLDVNPETGRVIVTWSNFSERSATGAPVEICSAYCDDMLTAPIPTWSPRKILNPGSTTFDTAAVPRFGTNNKVFVTWSQALSGTANKNIAFVVSNDDGQTWSPPRTLRSSPFLGMDQVQGNDTVNDFPSLATDLSRGRTRGNIYCVYADNTLRDGADVVFQRSIDNGSTFSDPISLSYRPGMDRSQWFPCVCVDQSNGRIHVFYFDQGLAKTGDLTQSMHLYSDDAGATWSAPTPLGESFHAALGKGSGQPNLGEYNEISAQSGELLAVEPIRLAAFSNNESELRRNPASLDLALHRIREGGAPVILCGVRAMNLANQTILQPGDVVNLSLALENYVTNPKMPAIVSEVTGKLVAFTQGVTLLRSTSSFPDLKAGAIGNSSSDFSIQLSPHLDVNTPIKLGVEIVTGNGKTFIPFELNCGECRNETLFQENFSSIRTLHSLPTDWMTLHAAGRNTIPWTVASSHFSATGLYHDNDEDGPGGESSRIESVLSPIIHVPDNARQIKVEFDIAFNTEDDSVFRTLAYDGCVLRIQDETSPNAPTTRLAESIADDIEMSSDHSTVNGLPKHLPESADPDYLQNVGAWGGNSHGLRHVSIFFSHLAGKNIRLRWDYTQDGSGIASESTGEGRGVLVTNISVNRVSRSTLSASAPSARPDVYSTNAGTRLQVESPGVLQNDIAGGHSALTVTLLQDPIHGALKLGPDGSFTYQPKEGFSGSDKFEYRVADSTGRTSAAVVNLSVNAVIAHISVPPNVPGGRPINGSIMLTGPAPADGMSVQIKGSPAAFDSETIFVKPHETSATFSLRTAKVSGVVSATITAAANGVVKHADLVITPEVAPLAVDHFFTAYEGNALRVSGSSLFSGCGGRQGPELRSAIASEPQHGSVLLMADGSFVYSPSRNFHGRDNFTYVLLDGESRSKPATVTLEVRPVLSELHLPSIVVSQRIEQAIVTLSGPAPYGGEVLEVHASSGLISLPRRVIIPQFSTSCHFPVTAAAVTVATNTVITVSCHGLEKVGSLTLAPLTPPAVKNHFYVINQDEKLVVAAPGLAPQRVSLGGPSPTAVDKPYHCQKCSDPIHGIVKVLADGAFSYTPANGYCGPDRFTYKVLGASGESSVANTEIWVLPSVSALSASAMRIRAAQPAELSVRLSAKASLDTLRISLSCSRPDLLTMPGVVVIQKGSDSTNFKICATAVSIPTDVYVYAKANGVMKAAMLVVMPLQGEGAERSAPAHVQQPRTVPQPKHYGYPGPYIGAM